MPRPAPAPPPADPIAPWRRRLDDVVVGGVERGLRWFFAHWLLALNAAAGLVLLGAVAAPLLAATGADGAAALIHELYLVLCPQRPGHSYFLLGHQLALEEREIAMFGAQLLAGLAFAGLRARSAWRLDWRLLVLAGAPMTWDVLSQQFGFRDSDWLTRTWTGALFVAAFVCWFYPLLEFGFRTRRGLGGARARPGVPAAGWIAADDRVAGTAARAGGAPAAQ